MQFAQTYFAPTVEHNWRSPGQSLPSQNMLLISLDRSISTSGTLEQSDAPSPLFVCSRIDYCNSLLIGLPKVRLSPIQSVLNAAARLVGRLPRASHISAFMFDHLHWLPLIARIQLKVLTLIYRSHIG